MALNLDPIKPVKTRVLANFVTLFKKLLPIGCLWKNLSELFHDFLESFAEEANRSDQRIIDLQTEAIPGLSTDGELLGDWEGVALLPDENTGTTEAERQDIVHTKIYTPGQNPTEEFFIEYASNIGITITIGSHDAFRVGTGRVGDRLYGAGAIAYIWIVNHTGGTTAQKEAMKAAFERLKPAHTEIEFNPAI